MKSKNGPARLKIAYKGGAFKRVGEGFEAVELPCGIVQCLNPSVDLLMQSVFNHKIAFKEHIPSRPSIGDFVKTLSHLFENNRKWAASVNQQDPDFFQRLAKQQTPKYLWIGCADSRVPATQICGLDPGEMFVHRNIANLISYRDINCLSVIDYAVNHLKVTDIIVCGHYGCGGVQGAIDQKNLGLINNWIQDISETYEKHYHDIQESCSSKSEKLNKLCELNVERQIASLSALPVVQSAWKSGGKLTIHGWIYSIENGLLKDLGHQTHSIEQLPEALRLKFDK